MPQFIRPHAGEILQPVHLTQILDELERLAKISGDHRILVSDGPDGFSFAGSGALSSSSTFIAQLFIQVQAPTLIASIPQYPWRQKVWSSGWVDGPASGTPIAAPFDAPTVSNSGSGGTITAGTYYVVIAYNTATGPTNMSPETSTTTTGATSTITITSPPAATGATGWFAYVGKASGGPYFLQGSSNAIGTDFTLTTPPVNNTEQASNLHNSAFELNQFYANPAGVILPAWYTDETLARVLFQLDYCSTSP